jgi:endonuclease G
MLALNAGPWLRLEDACRTLAQHDGRWVYVTAGPVWGEHPTRIGHDVDVPEAFWKVAVILPPDADVEAVTADTPVLAAVMPNQDGILAESWTRYRTTIGAAERASGYRLLGRVQDSVRTAIVSRTPNGDASSSWRASGD